MQHDDLPSASGAARAARTIGFLGLGIMGSAMSANMAKAGFALVGYDPVDAARSAFASRGGAACTTAAELASRADVIVSSLPHAEALGSAVDALLGAGRAGQVVIETSTLDIDAKLAARDRLAAAGVVLLDCPLSGTGAQAAVKDLVVYTSGPDAVVATLDEVFDGFSKAHYHLGEFGNGMRMKLMANLLVAIHNVSTAEVLLFGERLGIAADVAVKVLADGAGGSRMLQVRGPVIADRRWDPAAMKLSVWQKDMRLIRAALDASGSPAPLFAATEPLYEAALAAGHAEHDTASVYEVLARQDRAG